MIGKEKTKFELIFDEDWEAARRVYIRPTKEELEEYIMSLKEDIDE